MEARPKYKAIYFYCRRGRGWHTLNSNSDNLSMLESNANHINTLLTHNSRTAGATAQVGHWKLELPAMCHTMRFTQVILNVLSPIQESHKLPYTQK